MEVHEVAVDFGRGCVVWGDIGLTADVVKVEVVVPVGEGREEAVRESFDAEDDMDFGLVSLVVADTVGRTGLESSASSPTVFCVVGLRVAAEFERPRPNIPEFGLLLVTAPLPPAPAVPARALVVVDGPPSLGSLLGDMFPGSAGTGAEADGAARPLLLSSRILSATRGASFLSSSFLGALPRPAAGCRRERDRFSPVVDDEDDMVVRRGGCQLSPIACEVTTLSSSPGRGRVARETSERTRCGFGLFIKNAFIARRQSGLCVATATCHPCLQGRGRGQGQGQEQG